MADNRIQNILKISYDELDYMEKEIFLDIACFFKGEDRDHAESILQGCGFNARIGIGVLFNKALITITEQKLDMHDLLQQMGREIVREECVQEPWNCSRLWVPQDINNILTKDLGEVSVKSISLDILKTEDINLSSNAFTRMKKLRLLKFYNPYYPNEGAYDSGNGMIRIQRPRNLSWHRCTRGLLDFLPDELRYHHWYGYPSGSLPLKFSPKNLVQLHLIRSHVEQISNKNQVFESLKLMDLSYSVKLMRIADLSKFPKLEVLHLRGCTSLVEIRSSRQYGCELRHLNLESCRSLRYFSSFMYMECLDFLSLQECSKITEFPKVPRSLRSLILNKTALKQVPSSIEHCSQLTELELKSCTNLQSLPSNIGELQLLKCLSLEGCLKLMNLPDSTCNLMSLESLSIKECRNLKELPDNIGNLKSLSKLDATRSGIRVLPSSVNWLVKLEYLSCRGCRDIILPPFTGLPSLTKLLLDDCGLSEISDSLGSLKSLFGLYLDGNNLKKLPDSIKQLSMLKRLYLRDNRRLKCIPELPSSLQDLSVQNCTCLDSMWSFKVMNMNFLQLLDVRNCINLDQSWGRKIMDDVLLRIENMLPLLKHHCKPDAVFFTKEVLVCSLSIGFCIAGGELPVQMKHKNNSGSTIFISMEPDPFDFLVVIFSAVVVASTDNLAETATQICEYGLPFDDHFGPDPRIKCESCFVTESGCSLNECCSRALFCDIYCKPNQVMILENNLLWVWTFHFKDKQKFIEASFRFSTENGNFTVKKCGVHLLYSCDNYQIPPKPDPFFGYSSHCASFVSLT